MTFTHHSRSSDLESHGSHYQIPIEKLQSLFDPKSIRNLLKIGGLKALTLDLNTDLHSGLSQDYNENDIKQRINIYGKNKLPNKSQKSLLSLCWEALHDQVLIILSISAIISFVLGLYLAYFEPPEYDEDGNPLPNLEWVDGCAIILAVIIVVLVGAINDFNKEKQFMKLNNKKDDRKIIVYRSNVKTYISIYDLLVGDLLYVETGDIIPADAILISGECSCDESSLTGESRTIDKKPIDQALSYFNDEIKSIKSQSFASTISTSSSSRFDVGDSDVLDPFLVSGSKLLSGNGKALVICIGEHSVNGKMMMSLFHGNEDEEDAEETPLQVRLDHLANNISKYGFLAAIGLFLGLFLKFLYQLSTVLAHLSLLQKFSKFINIVITAITVVVVAIPEGLPLAVTLALAFATTRMMEDGNLVRVLKSCETMGGATCICSDKTGTLTINKMTIVEGLIGDDYFIDNGKKSTIDNSNHSHSSIEILQHCNDKLIDVLLKNIFLNSTAFENIEPQRRTTTNSELNKPKSSVLDSLKTLFKSERYNHILPLSSDSSNSNSNATITEKPDEFVGSKTECALLEFVKYKVSQVDPRIPTVSKYRDDFESNIVKTVPFESSLKWSGVVYHDTSKNNYTFLIKGAAEIVLDYCDYITGMDGHIQKFSKNEKENIGEKRQDMAKNALRAVSLAHYTFKESEISKIDWTKISADDLVQYPLVLDLIVGIQDPLRPGVREAIEQCHRAGVDVRMVTGDNVLTARAISKGCGILDDDTFDDPSYFMEGPKFRSLSDSERLRIIPNLHVLARSSPEDKRILVQTLKKLGEVVAVTGDGTNDAPALKLADVGFSMGISGTEVAREASDIVLMSDDFPSIVNAIKWGRTVAASIRKFVQFQLTVNFTAVTLTIVSAVASDDDTSVLTAVQLLWVNLIMDTLAALALATDKPDDDILDSKPEGRSKLMISPNMWKMILGMSIFQLGITTTLNFKGSQIFYGLPYDEVNTHDKFSLKAMTFNTFVWMQVFTLFVSRILNEPLCLNPSSTLRERLCYQNIGFFRNITRNYWFISIVSTISVSQVIIMFYGGRVFSIAPQTFGMWATALGSGFSMIFFGGLLRLVPDYWLTDYLPIDGLCRVIYGLEWFIFGCGYFQSPEHREDYESFFDSSDNIIQDGDNLVASQHSSDISRGTSSPTFVSSGSPSPMLEPSHSGETHKMNKLKSLLIRSNNTSASSLTKEPNERSSSFTRTRSPSQTNLFDSVSVQPNYTDIDVSASK